MAVNVPLLRGSEPPTPEPYVQEVFILLRRDVELEVKDARRTLVNGAKGKLHLTNIRMVFILDAVRPRDNVESIEIPFRGIHNERLNQPIFGANNLSGITIPYDNQPFEGDVRFRLSFKRGGLGTFLPRFNFVLGGTRRSERAWQRQRDEAPAASAAPAANAVPAPQTDIPAAPSYGVPYDASSFTAIVDPSDPSQIYLHQPAPAQGATHTPGHLKGD